MKPQSYIIKFLNLISNLINEEITENEFINPLDINNEKKKLACFYFEIIRDKNLFNKIEQIYNEIPFYFDYTHFSNCLKIKINFKKKDMELFISFIIAKSIHHVSVTDSIKNIYYLNSDEVLNNIIKEINNFLIYYYEEVLTNEREIKTIFFKFIEILVFKKIIYQIIVKISQKTQKEWSLNEPSLQSIFYDHLNISFSQLEIIEIRNRKFLKGKFMNRIQEIFKTNLHSGERVIIKNLSILNEFCQLSVKLDKERLTKVIETIENHENIKFENLKEMISDNNEKILKNIETIYTKKKENKEKYEINYEKELTEEIRKTCEKIRFKSYEDICIYIVLKKVIYFIFEKLKKKIKKNTHIFSYLFDDLSIFLFVCINYQEILNIKFKYNEKYVFKKIEESTNKNEININSDIWDTFNLLNKKEFEKILINNNKWVKKYINFRLNNFSVKKNNFYLVKKEGWVFNNQNYEFFLNDSFKKLEEVLNDESTTNNILEEILLIFSNFEKSKNKNEWEFDKILNKVKYMCLKWETKGLSFYSYLKNNKENFYLEEQTKKNYKLLSKYLIFYNLFVLNNFKNIEEENIYFLFFFDFRGRFYYRSPIGVTECKYSRYIYYYGIYEEKEIIEIENNKKVEELYYSYFKDIQEIKEKYNIENKLKIIDECIFWIIIAISKIFINKEKEKISTTEIIEKGIEKIKKKEDKLSLEDEIEYNYYLSLLSELSKKKIKKLPILKDSTASFMQNLIRIMGYKNEESLKNSNLIDSDYWYNTYLFILNSWKEKEKKKHGENYKEEDYKIFTRSTIKPTVMTKPYAAKYLSSLERFRVLIEEKFKIKIEIGDENEIRFKSFYNFLENDLQDIFLANNSYEMVNYVKKKVKKNEEIYIETHDSKVDLTYYQQKSQTIDVIINIPSYNIKKRITKTHYELDKSKKNTQKIIDSVRANWVQNTDSLYIRDIQKDMKVCYLTIHDCVLVDMLRVSNFIISANKQSNIVIFSSMPWENKKKNEFFSIFIFI